MKVADLIEALQGMDPTLDVHFAYGYGDHWRTEVAPKVSQVSEGVVEFSDYHRMDKLVTIEEDYDIYDEDTNETRTEVRRVVVID
jgi:tRNA/tmRNA/rRNA uracil-C5-methylase (TrmA/RlmC/RlmD family)